MDSITSLPVLPRLDWMHIIALYLVGTTLVDITRAIARGITVRGRCTSCGPVKAAPVAAPELRLPTATLEDEWPMRVYTGHQPTGSGKPMSPPPQGGSSVAPAPPARVHVTTRECARRGCELCEGRGRG